jgi:hypothetical protein
MSSNNATKWLTNNYTCKISDSIDNLKGVYALNLKIKEVFRRGATKFDHFTTDGAGEIWERLVQLFIKFGESLFKTATRPTANGRHAVVVSASNKEEPVQFYMEMVIKEDDHNNSSIEVSDYTLYILVKDDATTVDPGEIWKNLITEAELFNAKAKASVSQYKKVDSRHNVKKDQKWMLVDGKLDLAILHASYTGRHDATQKLVELNSYDISHSSNPVSCDGMFNIPDMFRSRCAKGSKSKGYERCIKLQSLANYKEYMTVKREGVYKMSFPLKGFVMKITPNAFTVESMMNKIFPHQQKKHMDIFPMLPTILRDYETSGMLLDGLETKGLATKYSAIDNERDNEGKIDVHQNDEDIASVIDGVSKMNVHINMEQQLNELSMQMGRPQSSLDTTGSNTNDDEDEDEVALREMSSMMGLSYDKPSSLVPVTAMELSESMSHTRKNVELDESLVEYTSDYGPMLQMAKRNSNANHVLAKEVMTKGNITHKHSVVRQMVLMSKQSCYLMYERCRSSSGNFSPYERAMYKAILEGKLYEGGHRTKKFDDTITSFASYECEHTMKLELLYCMASGHWLSNILRMYSNDVTRQDFDTHNSICMVDDGESGKSFVLEICKEQRIDGTTETETDSSEKAELTSEPNMNGGVVICHELQRRYMHEDKYGKSEKASMQKDIMSSGKARSRRLVKDNETGKFKQELTETEKIRVNLTATNKDVDRLMDYAMKTRYHIVYVESTCAMDRTLLQLKLMETIMTDSEKMGRTQHNKFCHLMQALHFEVDRMIWGGALHNVSMHTAMVIIVRFERELAVKRPWRKVPSRAFLRTLNMSRTYAVQDAIMNIFFTPSAKYYGQDVELKKLFQSIDRRLVCYTQHVIAAIGQQLSQYIDQHMDSVVQILKEYHLTIRDVVRYKRSKKSASVFDPTYASFRIKGESLDKFCQILSDFSKRNTNCKRISARTIKRSILGMREMHVLSRKYRIDPMNELSVIEDTATPSELRQVVEITQQTVNVLYHTLYVNTKTQRDEIVDILKGILEYDHQYAKKLVFDNNEDYPYIKNFIETKETHGKGLLMIPTAARLTKFAKAIMQEDTEYVDCEKEPDFTGPADLDIDMWALKHRNEVLGITKDPTPRDFADINCFLDDHGGSDVDSTGTKKVQTPRERMLDPATYRTNESYFMGDTLESYFKFKDISKVDNITEKIKRVYDKMDREVDVKEDYDFDYNDFIVGTYKATGKTCYHWDVLDKGLSDPSDYKMICYHPMIVNHLDNIRCGFIKYDDVDTKVVTSTMDPVNYPDDVIDEAKEKRARTWDYVINFCKDNNMNDMVAQLKNGSRYSTYELDEKSTGVVRQSNVYTSAEAMSQSTFRSKRKPTASASPDLPRNAPMTDSVESDRHAKKFKRHPIDGRLNIPLDSLSRQMTTISTPQVVTLSDDDDDNDNYNDGEDGNSTTGTGSVTWKKPVYEHRIDPQLSDDEYDPSGDSGEDNSNSTPQETAEEDEIIIEVTSDCDIDR